MVEGMKKNAMDVVVPDSRVSRTGTRPVRLFKGVFGVGLAQLLRVSHSDSHTRSSVSYPLNTGNEFNVAFVHGFSSVLTR